MSDRDHSRRSPPSTQVFCGNLTENQSVRRVRAEHGMSLLGRIVHGRSSWQKFARNRARANASDEFGSTCVSMSANAYPCLTLMLTPATSRNDARAAVRRQTL